MKIVWWWLIFTLQGPWFVSQVAGEDSAVDTTNDDGNKDDSMVFQHFVAHNKTMTCTADEHARPFNNQVRGVNLGGWMVSE